MVYNLLIKALAWWNSLWDATDRSVEVRLMGYGFIVFLSAFWISYDIIAHKGITTQCATVACGLYGVISLGSLGVNNNRGM